MAKVRITKFEDGANKVALVGIVQQHLVLGLKNSKDAVDDVFGGQTREFEIEDEERVDAFASRLRDAKATVEVQK